MKWIAVLVGPLIALCVLCGRRTDDKIRSSVLLKTHLAANGYDTTLLLVETSSLKPPRIAIDNPHAIRVQNVTRTDRGWQATLRAGVMPGAYVVTAYNAHTTLILGPDNTDSAGDGTP